jgi:Uma2 family endonuclease
MNAPVAEPKKVWTEADLQALPEDGFNHELVDGELVISPKNDFLHGKITARLSAALLVFAEARRLGSILDSSTGFRMNNLNVRAPDISFVSRERLKALEFGASTRAFFPGAPDLAIEVLSPNNTRKEIDARLKDYFSSGARLAWIIDPTDQRVEICHSLTQRKRLGSADFLDGENVLPGFRHSIAELFKVRDWE